MEGIYTAVCVQAKRRTINHRSEIREANLNRALELIDYAARRMGFPKYAPVKLILFPEVFLQGWPYDPGPYSNLFQKVANDVAIQIPGEETELLSEKARKYNVYIAGTAHEITPELGPDYPFNCAFIIDPRGEVIYKHHKYCPYFMYEGYDDVSPHDVYDRYIEAMDGKYGRKKGDIVSCFFPVVETDIGKLGYIICNEGFFIEHSKALGLQGCEVMLRSSGMLEPEGSPPQQTWEIQNRAAALFNMMYVVAAAPSLAIIPMRPTSMWSGYSMVVEFTGALLQHVLHTEESVTAATINVEMLRSRRTEPKHNFSSQLRTEVYREMYKPMYPKNLWLDKLPTDMAERMAQVPIDRLIEEGIWIAPKT